MLKCREGYRCTPFLSDNQSEKVYKMKHTRRRPASTRFVSTVQYVSMEKLSHCRSFLDWQFLSITKCFNIKRTLMGGFSSWWYCKLSRQRRHMLAFVCVCNRPKIDKPQSPKTGISQQTLSPNVGLPKLLMANWQCIRSRRISYSGSMVDRSN